MVFLAAKQVVGLDGYNTQCDITGSGLMVSNRV